MKLPLDLPRLVAEQLGRGLIEIPVSIDVGMFLEYSELDETDLDLHELLRANRMIGQFYTVEDVLSLRPHLTEDQAWQVLQAIESTVDTAPKLGVNSDGICGKADTLFPSTTAYTGHVTISIESDKVLSLDDANQLYSEIASDISHRHRYVRTQFDRTSTQDVRVPSDGGQP